jgi:hypothetical protein
MQSQILERVFAKQTHGREIGEGDFKVLVAHGSERVQSRSTARTRELESEDRGVVAAFSPAVAFEFAWRENVTRKI